MYYMGINDQNTPPNDAQNPSSDSPSGTFVIPDIEPFDAPSSPPPSSMPSQDFSSANVFPDPSDLSSQVSQTQSSSLPLHQTVVVEETPENISLPQGDTSAMPSQVLPENPIPPLNNDILPQGYIPQGLMPNVDQAKADVSNGGAPPTMQLPNDASQFQQKPSRGFGKKILIILIILFVLGGIGAAGMFGLRMIQDRQEVTIQYWGLWENPEIVAPVIAEFESQNPTIKVRYTKQSHRQYRERLQAAINRGDGPDVFRFHATWVPMLKNEIEPIPADVVSPSQFTSQFYKVAAQDLLAGSTLWGIPIMIDGLGLYVNDDIFSAAGLTPPQTYEDLLAVVPLLTVKDGNTIITSAIALGTTNNVEHFSDILALMMMQNGVRLTNPTGREAEEALLFYKKFANPTDPLYTWNSLLDNSIVSFANGRVAMIFAPSWRVFDIKEINPSLRFRIEPVPQLPGNTVTWASYWVEGVSSKSKHKKQAMRFLQYITSKESVIKLYTEASKQRLFGEPYALVELANTVESDPFVGVFIRQAPNARSFPLASLTHDNGINDRMIQYMIDAVNSLDKSVPPSQALDTMAKGFQQVLSSYGLIGGGSPR